MRLNFEGIIESVRVREGAEIDESGRRHDNGGRGGEQEGRDVGDERREYFKNYRNTSF
jgi:hypothetical protein